MNMIHNKMSDLSRQLQQLDLNLLKIFESLYLEQNMSVVARQLCITPSAVSHAVNRLRTSLDDPLFVRKGQQMVPTSRCANMAPQLLAALKQLRQALQIGGEFIAEDAELSLTIAIPDALEPLLMPALFTHLNNTVAKLELVSVRLERQETLKQLSFGNVDFVIDIARPLKKPVLHQRLNADELVVMCNDKNQTNSIDQKTYLASEHLVVSNRPAGLVLEDFALLQQGFNRDIKVRTQNYQTAVEMAKESELLLTLPAKVAKQYQQQGLSVHKLPFEHQQIETHLYWHESRNQDSVSLWVREQILTLELLD